MANVWSDTQRVALDAILDQLIPPNPARRIPGAGQLGVADFLADVASRDEALREAVTVLLQRVVALGGAISTEMVQQLEATLPAPFNLLLTHTYKGYYSRPDMRAKTGVGAHPVHPTGYRVESDTAEFLAALTAPVIERGPCYRDPGVAND